MGGWSGMGPLGWLPMASTRQGVDVQPCHPLPLGRDTAAYLAKGLVGKLHDVKVIYRGWRRAAVAYRGGEQRCTCRWPHTGPGPASAGAAGPASRPLPRGCGPVRRYHPFLTNTTERAPRTRPFPAPRPRSVGRCSPPPRSGPRRRRRTVYAARPPAAKLAVTPPPALPVTDSNTATAEPTLF